MRFVVDCMLGKLARWLRVLGHDVIYHSFAEDNELLRIAQTEDRVLLTRDGPLAERVPDRCLRIEATDLDAQLAQLVSAFGLDLERRPFTRCLECNDPLESAAPGNVRADVPTYVFEKYTEFHRCPSCGRVYWAGSHYDRMQAHLARLKRSIRKLVAAN